jgi:hypothetical protein
MQKKPYTPPTITEHGKVIEQTKGVGGRYWEVINPKPASDIIIIDD